MLGTPYNYYETNVYASANENTKLVSSIYLPAGIYIVKASARSNITPTAGNQFIFVNDGIYDVYGFYGEFAYDGMSEFIFLQSSAVFSYGICPTIDTSFMYAKLEIIRIK